MSQIVLSSTGETLVRMSESDYHLRCDGEDLRGWLVFDREGNLIGEVTDLLVSEQRSKICFVEVTMKDERNEKSLLVPVDAIEDVMNDSITLATNRNTLIGAPRYHSPVVSERTINETYGFFGGKPFWMATSSPSFGRHFIV